MTTQDQIDSLNVEIDTLRGNYYRHTERMKDLQANRDACLAAFLKMCEKRDALLWQIKSENGKLNYS